MIDKIEYKSYHYSKNINKFKNILFVVNICYQVELHEQFYYIYIYIYIYISISISIVMIEILFPPQKVKQLIRYNRNQL